MSNQDSIREAIKREIIFAINKAIQPHDVLAFPKGFFDSNVDAILQTLTNALPKELRLYKGQNEPGKRGFNEAIKQVKDLLGDKK
jgi:hypothetical protein